MLHPLFHNVAICCTVFRRSLWWRDNCCKVGLLFDGGSLLIVQTVKEFESHVLWITSNTQCYHAFLVFEELLLTENSVTDDQDLLFSTSDWARRWGSNFVSEQKGNANFKRETFHQHENKQLYVTRHLFWQFLTKSL